MRRVFSAGLALLGVTLLLASAWLGVRSFYVHERHVYESKDDYTTSIVSKNGRFDLLYLSPWAADEPGWLHFSRPADGTLSGTDYSRRILGFGGGKRPNGGIFVNIPYWFTAALGAVPPLLFARRERRRRRVRLGGCPVCGYDLRATPDRCPECGASPSRPAAPADAALLPDPRRNGA